MHIGNVEINSQLYLAPMAGVTDMAFRQIWWVRWWPTATVPP